jgi:hypothetical protein
MMIHILSRYWNKDMYYSQPYDHFQSFQATFKHQFLQEQEQKQQTFLQDYTIFYLKNYFSYSTYQEAFHSLFIDCLSILGRCVSFIPTGFLLFETLKYCLLSERIGIRAVRYFGLENVNSWIIDFQLNINRVIFVTKTAIHHLQQRNQPPFNGNHFNNNNNNINQVDFQEQGRVANRRGRAGHRRRLRQGMNNQEDQQNNNNNSNPININNNNGPPPTIPAFPNAFNHQLIAEKNEMEMLKQFHHAYEIFYYPFLKTIVFKGFLGFILTVSLILSNQPLLQLFRFVPFYEWIQNHYTYSANTSSANVVNYEELCSANADLHCLFVFRIHWAIMRCCILVYFLSLILPYAISPLSTSFKLLEKKIRDENYLIGKKLLNLSEKKTPSQSPPPPPPQQQQQVPPVAR